jgi:hypothetical protein
MKERIAIFIIWVLIIADLSTGLLFNLRFSYYRIGLGIKIVIIVFSLLYYLPLIRKRSFLSLYVSILLLIFIWIIAASISKINNTEFNLINSFIVLNRYLFFLVLACIFLNFKDSRFFKDSCGRIFESFFKINNFLIFIGFLFEINLFSSFHALEEFEIGQRFGYKGLISGNNEVAGIYSLGIAYFYREIFKYKKTKKFFLLILTCLAAVFTGAKAAFIALVLISLYYLVRYKLLLFLTAITPVIILLVYFIAARWEFLKERYLSFMISKYYSVDLISFLTSGRDSYLVKNFAFIDTDWNVMNYLVGDAFLYSEMDFFDLYFFFGLGSIIYFYIYTKFFFMIDRTLDNFYIFISLMAIAFTAGHIIQSAIVPLFLLLYIFSNNSESHESKGHKSKS